MMNSVLRVLKAFFDWTPHEFEASEAFQDLERKKHRVRIIIQGRLL